jgi:hypothetical protein
MHQVKSSQPTDQDNARLGAEAGRYGVATADRVVLQFTGPRTIVPEGPL